MTALVRGEPRRCKALADPGLAIGHVDRGSEKFLTRLNDELAADELVCGSLPPRLP